ncbi:ATP-binding cassette domain-containing protein [Thermoflavimicrobium dichotomicum]|nr:ATP-binding cassette domain-containing protein [Thermoflavimicrobium dichotomicum]
MTMWIEWSHVTKIYEFETENKWARNIGLLDFSASVQSGITVILGPRGAGKSTLLKITAMMMLPDDGRVTFHTHHQTMDWSTGNVHASRPEQLGELRRKIGYVPLVPRLDQEMTVELALFHLAQLYGTPDPRKRSCEMMIRWGLAGYRQTPLMKLRGGVLKRFLLAQSLLLHPTFWILDEPTRGLDLLGKQLLREELQRQPKDRITIIATHDMQLAECADYLMLLESGACRRLGKKKLLTAGVSEGTVAAWYQAMQVFSKEKSSFKV